MRDKVHNEIAQYAYQKVLIVAAQEKELSVKREFRSLARSLPSKIQVNGFAATSAFLHSKAGNKNACESMEEMIDEWTAMRFKEPENNDPFIERVVGMDSNTYRLYTNEVMNLCLWIKRFAEGLIAGDEE